MPVKISVRSAEYCAANDSRFDACVRRLAPIIREVREDHARRSTRKLDHRLNDMGGHGPNGRKFTPRWVTHGQPRRYLDRRGDATKLAARCSENGHF